MYGVEKLYPLLSHSINHFFNQVNNVSLNGIGFGTTLMRPELTSTSIWSLFRLSRCLADSTIFVSPFFANSAVSLERGISDASVGIVLVSLASGGGGGTKVRKAAREFSFCGHGQWWPFAVMQEIPTLSTSRLTVSCSARAW